MAYKNKSDQKDAAKRHYELNKSKMIARAKVHAKQADDRIRTYITGYLNGHPCVDCGESDRIVLEFDHRDRSRKKFNIGNAIRSGYSLLKVISEIEKCDVRCANCHRRKTHRERIDLSIRRIDDLPPLPLFGEPDDR